MDLQVVKTFYTNDVEEIDNVDKLSSDYINSAKKAGYTNEQIQITPLMYAGRYDHAFNYSITVVLLK